MGSILKSCLHSLKCDTAGVSGSTSSGVTYLSVACLSLGVRYFLDGYQLTVNTLYPLVGMLCRLLGAYCDFMWADVV